MAKKKAKKKVVKKKAKKKTSKKTTRKTAKRAARGEFSSKVTKKIIQILREGDEKMTIPQIAKVIGKSKATVYNMDKGKARLSAEDYGKLAGSIGHATIDALQNITLEDVKEVADDVKKAVQGFLKKSKNKGIEFSKTAAEKGPKMSKSGAKYLARKTGGILKATGDFLKSLGQ